MTWTNGGMEAAEKWFPGSGAWDWDSAFDVAVRDGIHRVEGSDADEEQFSTTDIAQVLASSEGENDGADWMCVVLLNDLRYVFLQAGCDYTGWG